MKPYLLSALTLSLIAGLAHSADTAKTGAAKPMGKAAATIDALREKLETAAA